MDIGRIGIWTFLDLQPATRHARWFLDSFRVLGLTAAVFTKNIDKVMQFVHDIEAGSVFVNTACVGAEIQLPFGGMKGSGNGRREGAYHMLDIYTEWKTVSIQEN